MANVQRESWDGDRPILKEELRQLRQELKKRNLDASFINLRLATDRFYWMVEQAEEMIEEFDSKIEPEELEEAELEEVEEELTVSVELSEKQEQVLLLMLSNHPYSVLCYCNSYPERTMVALRDKGLIEMAFGKALLTPLGFRVAERIDNALQASMNAIADPMEKFIEQMEVLKTNCKQALYLLDETYEWNYEIWIAGEMPDTYCLTVVDLHKHHKPMNFQFNIKQVAGLIDNGRIDIFSRRLIDTYFELIANNLADNN
ncbi:MAG: hypothetical protein F6K14_26750 [Symploca sp. SIO2C1]|nr:hypothetical protein [Symploca sp. SIO2C1]